MSSTALQLPSSFEEAERFQRLFVLPVVEAMETKLENLLAPMLQTQKAVTDKVDGFDARVIKLETGQKHALWGWGVYATAVAAAMAAGWKYISSKVHIG